MVHRLPVVLVTGASGFVGSAVVDALSQDHRVVALDQKPPDTPWADAEFVALDVTSDASVAAALARVRQAHGATIASVLHLAAFIDMTGANDPKYESVTVQGTGRLLEGLKAFEVQQFVFMSTLLAQAPSGHGHRIDEDAPLDDSLPYPASKIRTEKLLRERHGAIPVVILRAAGIYDEMCHAAFLDHQIARINERRLTSHVYPGDLAAGQPYLHLADLVAALRRTIERRADLPPESTFLLGESDVMGFDEIQQAVGKGLHREPWQTIRIPAPLAGAGAWAEDKLLDEDPFIRPWMVRIASHHYEIDTTRARTQLDWAPVHTLRDTLPKMLDALRRDPVAWYEANHLDSARVAADSIAAKPGKASPDMQAEMPSDRAAMAWTHWLNLFLGAWLVASPFAFGSFEATGFGASVLHVTADRHLADPAWRSAMLGRSDLVAGALVMLFGALSLSVRMAWAQWANAVVGTWLLFAPLVFWSPSAAVYTNDTFVGALVIAFAIVVPMMPGMAMAGMMDTSDRPPGWSYSPSSYLQRLPIVALGAFGFLVARTLAAYQLGHVASLHDPFFAGLGGLDGSEAVITSSVSKAWPIPDAGLGGVAYVFEVLMGAMGDGRRWRTMPWMVAMFGVVVVPLGVVSITFVVIQPIVIGTWCTPCLVTAAAMLAMIPLSLDELVAVGQYLVQAVRRGEPFWTTFFRGGAQPQGSRDKHAGADAAPAEGWANATRGVTIPWSLALCALVGAALMFTRPLLGHAPPLANSDHLAGALVVTVAVISMAEVARALRLLNVAFGAWLFAAPWLLAGGVSASPWIEALAGLAIVALSLPRGSRSRETYGSWNRFVV